MKITTEDIRVSFQAKEILKGISIETRDKELVGSQLDPTEAENPLC